MTQAPTPEQEERFNMRYQNIVARFYTVQAHFHKLQAEAQAIQAECERLRETARIKQGVIATLLPYYPHPITPEMQAQLDLA